MQMAASAIIFRLIFNIIIPIKWRAPIDAEFATTQSASPFNLTAQAYGIAETARIQVLLFGLRNQGRRPSTIKPEHPPPPNPGSTGEECPTRQSRTEMAEWQIGNTGAKSPLLQAIRAKMAPYLPAAERLPIRNLPKFRPGNAEYFSGSVAPTRLWDSWYFVSRFDPSDDQADARDRANAAMPGIAGAVGRHRHDG
jgi:hypothetical protein